MQGANGTPSATYYIITTTDLTSPLINSDPWFIPKYGRQPQGPRWLFWQDRDNLTVSGIGRPVDHSLFAGTEDELAAWYKSGTLPRGF